MTSSRGEFDLLIADLDNTIYDWEAFFIPAFQAMIREVERISGVGRDVLEPSFRRVYQRHRTSEYAFVLQELDALRAVDRDLSPAEVFAKYDLAIHAFRSVRKRKLVLYPGVRTTLTALKSAGVRIVAHSDSPMGYVSRRLRQLDVDELFDAVCAPRDHGVPAEIATLVRQSPDSSVAARTRLIEYDPAVRKPNPATLGPLFAEFPYPRDRIAYVGDNLSRDVLLARRARVTAIWARYGAQHDAELRQQLYRITYWTDADVAAEQRLRAESDGEPPDFVIDSFAEVLTITGVVEPARTSLG
jgi:FMN phosphatase YigB (HAD superfamily)